MLLDFYCFPESSKYHFANSFARFLLCQQRTTDACGYRQSCHWFNAATHPDLIRIQPEEEGKAIKIAQIRQLVHDLSHTASQIGYQVVILHPAEAMNKAAANALLKILEEPPGQVCMLLISSQPYFLTATVRSRCQKIHLNAPKQQAVQWLQQQLKVNQSVELLLTLANGAPLAAVQLENQDNLQQRDMLFSTLEQLVIKKITPLEVAAQWSKLPLFFVLQWYACFVMDAIRHCSGLDDCYLMNSDKKDFLKKIAQNAMIEQLFQQLDRILEAIKWISMSQLNLNQQLLLEDLLISGHVM